MANSVLSPGCKNVCLTHARNQDMPCLWLSSTTSSGSFIFLAKNAACTASTVLENVSDLEAWFHAEQTFIKLRNDTSSSRSGLHQIYSNGSWLFKSLSRPATKI